jgi:prepilin-type processing-associated H-X9-DG protein
VLNDQVTADPFANGNTSFKLFVEQGAMLGEAMNDGPAYWNATAGDAVSLIDSNGANLRVQVDSELAGSIPVPTGPTGSETYLQDTRDWYTVHGGGSSSSANILMADGSVKEFADLNSDKFLNPGFPVPNGLSGPVYAGIGYRSSEVELPPGQMFNGIFLVDLSKNSKFEP